MLLPLITVHLFVYGIRDQTQLPLRFMPALVSLPLNYPRKPGVGGRSRQSSDFEADLVYTMCSQPSKATWYDCLKKEKRWSCLVQVSVPGQSTLLFCVIIVQWQSRAAHPRAARCQSQWHCILQKIQQSSHPRLSAAFLEADQLRIKHMAFVGSGGFLMEIVTKWPALTIPLWDWGS